MTVVAARSCTFIEKCGQGWPLLDLLLRSRMNALVNGAHEWNRTIDLFLTKEVLYRLSYMSGLFLQVVFFSRRSPLERETGIEPAPSAWKAEVLPLNYSRIVRNGEASVVEGGG